MQCPTVTTIGGDTTSAVTFEGAVSSATEIARGRAAPICKASGGECTGIRPIPESIELLKFTRDVDENDVERWTVLLKCTFRCQSKRGCWPLATPEKSEPISDMSSEDKKKYFEKSRSQE